ncbi:MAG: hypothetical protein NW217_01560 [Hyphomicrobiaceae bacterium]|nr:hypothetical protein [Hyphomicrobiaceae bacterium]
MPSDLNTLTPSRCRALAALELRNAGRLRRDLAAGLLPRRPALFAARDCLRHAKALTVSAYILRQV